MTDTGGASGANDGATANPLRSEAAMFRVFVYVLVAALPVIAAGALVGPLAGLVVLGLELGIALGLLLSRRR